jgi:cell division protein FtsL
MKTKSPAKKVSVFYFLILLVITSIILIIYINNIIAVNQLSAGNNDLREEIKKIVQSNDLLRAESEQLTSFDRIKSIASEKYNLTYKDNSSGEVNKVILRKSQLK